MNSQTVGADQYAVVGNPVAHSLSPQIHRAFAQQTQQVIEYQAIELSPGQFELQLRELQESGLKGANVTVPFKREAWEICDERSPRAEIAGAVNTLVFREEGIIDGDNTDGVGLTQDLLNNNRVPIRGRKILILGAGGAARGVLAPLLSLEPGRIMLANRTAEKAEKLANDFHHAGNIKACGLQNLGEEKFDLVINATAAGLDGKVPMISAEVLGMDSFCYDMMYSIDSPTAFVSWAQSHGASQTTDGLGMLVEQAAESFFIWRGVRVDTAEVIANLRASREA